MAAEHFEIPETAANLPVDYYGFLCYARKDDRDEHGRITCLRMLIQEQFRVMKNRALAIFQDVEGIRTGDDWDQIIGREISEVQLLLPVMTPAFFTSEQCRSEVERFDARKDPATRIIPIYYADVPDLESSDDPLQVMLRCLNYADFRQVRLSDQNSSAHRTVVAKLVEDIADTMPDSSPRPSRPAVPAYEPGRVLYRSAPRFLYVLQNVVGDAGPTATVQYRLASTDGLDLISYPVELREGFFNVSAAFRGAKSDSYGRHCVRLPALDSEENAQSVTVQILGMPEHCDTDEDQISANLVTGADSHGRVIITFDVGAP